MAQAPVTLTVLDFESTGSVPGFPEEPWQIGLCRIVDNRVDERSLVMHYLHVGNRPFNPHAPGRHHELRGVLGAAPTLQTLWPSLQPLVCSGPLAAHNVATEKKFLRYAAPLHRFGPWVDTLRLARRAYPKESSHTLEALIVRLGLRERVRAVVPDREFHDALFDAAACAVLLEHLLTLPGWDAVTPDDLAACR